MQSTSTPSSDLAVARSSDSTDSLEQQSHECYPECPKMAEVLANFKSMVNPAGYCSSIEKLGFLTLQNMAKFTARKNLGKISQNYYVHIQIFAERYSKMFSAQTLSQLDTLPEELPQPAAVNSVSPADQPLIKSGTCLTSSHIREILSSIGCTFTGGSFTNEEAARLLLENVDQIRMLVQQGKLTRLQLRQIKYFAIDNIDALGKRAKSGRRGQKTSEPISGHV